MLVSSLNHYQITFEWNCIILQKSLHKLVILEFQNTIDSKFFDSVEKSIKTIAYLNLL